jgi:hypothetical protein
LHEGGNRFKVVGKVDIWAGEEFFACLFSLVIIIIIPITWDEGSGGNTGPCLRLPQDLAE